MCWQVSLIRSGRYQKAPQFSTISERNRESIQYCVQYFFNCINVTVEIKIVSMTCALIYQLVEKLKYNSTGEKKKNNYIYDDDTFIQMIRCSKRIHSLSSCSFLHAIGMLTSLFASLLAIPGHNYAQLLRPPYIFILFLEYPCKRSRK